MIDRQIAILIDGGFFLKRLPKLVRPSLCSTAEAVAGCMRHMCRNHVKYLTGDEDTRWHRHVYRIFFYDALPYDGVAHHPIENRQINFKTSELARFRLELFDVLRRQRNVALRLGKVVRESDWAVASELSRKILATKAWIAGLDLDVDDGTLRVGDAELREGRRLQQIWSKVDPSNVRLGLRQKGVDMRIGLDIASIALKRQANTIILVSGDSDFVPAAKLARREGIQFILDPLWQTVNADLFEHIDGMQSGLSRPKLQAETAANQANLPDAATDGEESVETDTRREGGI